MIYNEQWSVSTDDNKLTISGDTLNSGSTKILKFSVYDGTDRVSNEMTIDEWYALVARIGKRLESEAKS
jgi:hypothetical protein